MKSLIDKAVQIIIELYDPDEILLFGSYAKGEETIWSDIDLLVVKPTPNARQNRGIEVVEYLKKYPQKFDLLFYTPAEILEQQEKAYSFINSILISSKSLYKKV